MESTASLLADLGIHFVPVPGLAPAVELLIFIWNITQKVCIVGGFRQVNCSIALPGVVQQEGIEEPRRFQCRYTDCRQHTSLPKKDQ